MVFLERLRQRLRRRRLERKLQQLSHSGSRTREPQDLLTSRVKIKPLDGQSSTVLTLEETDSNRVKADNKRGPTQTASLCTAERQQPDTHTLDQTLVRFVAVYKTQSLEDFKRERQVLLELESTVPTIRPLLVKWIEWHTRSQQVVLRSSRDVERWKAFNEQARAEMQNIHGDLIKASATAQKDRKLTAQRIHTIAMPLLTPQAQAMVLIISVALVAGVYGLLLLVAFLKYKKRI